MSTQIKNLKDVLEPGEQSPPGPWDIKVIQSEDCMSYVAWNTNSKEGVIVDPKLDDQSAYEKLLSTMKDYRWIGVIDTHTHADHISCAGALSEKYGIPLVMHELSPSKKISLRVCKVTSLAMQSSPLTIIPTPGHTPDSLTVFWGPYIFTGDTILFGDVGRDDLPGGDPASHYDSLDLIKKKASAEAMVLPGHDSKGRVSSWETQMKTNSSLVQDRKSYIEESSAFDAPAPKLLKKSLRENFK